MIISEVYIASEISNLINFFICDIIFLGVVMQTTSVIAGMLNYFHLSKSKDSTLHTFSIPHVGGGVVMREYCSLVSLLVIRISVIAAICASNFGLQGRSQLSFTEKNVAVRRPGPFPKMPPEEFQVLLFDTTQIRLRCIANGDGDLEFASVLDEKCYPQLKTELYIKTLGLKHVNISRTLKNCKKTIVRAPFNTVVQCDDIEMNCSGPHASTGKLQPETCETVVYDGDVSWYCGSRKGFLVNITEVQTAECRKVGARRRDIQLWTELYGNHTTGMIEAIFAAAYGTETRITTNIPGGTRNITVITLWWLIPFSWVVTVMLGSFICVGVLWLYGARPVAHDEKSLVKLLERKPDPPKVELRSDFDFVEWK